MLLRLFIWLCFRVSANFKIFDASDVICSHSIECPTLELCEIYFTFTFYHNVMKKMNSESPNFSRVYISANFKEPQNRASVDWGFLKLNRNP